MFCCISGQEPTEPVVSVKSGHLFEKRLVEEYIQQHEKCPITDQPLTLDDLVAVKSNPNVKPRPASATSIPGMLQLFQNEWDSLMLETFTMKKHLDTVRQELSHALYQHDAACRVVSRLVKERDAARESVSESKKEETQMEVDSGLPESVITEIQQTSEVLTSKRKERKMPPTLVSPQDLSNYHALSSYDISDQGLSCIDIHPQNDTKVVAGGTDGNINLFNTDSKEVVSTFKSGDDSISQVLFHPIRDAIISSSHSGEAHMWVPDGDSYKVGSTMEAHEGPVTGITLHPSGNYAVTCSKDGQWIMHDVSSGSALVKTPSESEYLCTQFHPDGLLIGTGDNSVVKVWDVKTQKSLVDFKEHNGPIVSMSFSENGYSLASASEDGTVKIWDLRKLQCVNTLSVKSPRHVKYDHSGLYLGVAGTELNVFQNKSWNQLLSLSNHNDEITGVAFGTDANSIVSCSMDKTIKFYGV
eukprot:gb/GECH01012343.1/.p1 GENE.gb/GECH01012343.1/~~gb/GECH01012343.1/.p1  ORF type:complete len:471 (+),score=114.27 gb/GECH01012343.1/:1-1413(+)